MNRLKAAVLAAVFTVSGAVCASAYDDSDIKVRIDGLVNGSSQVVSFDSFRPIQIETNTFVPARAVAEAAGMTVEWDQSAQTALITLRADAYSSKPIERYGAELISKIGGYGLDLEPVDITAALKLYDRNAVLRYNFADSDGDLVAIGKTIEMSSEATLVDDAALMIPLRNAMEIFGLDIEWHQESLTAEVSIPEEVLVPAGLKIIANHTSVPEEETQLEINADNQPEVNRGEYIGKFKITKYCPCQICNGGWGDNTAWAGKIVPGQTVAVDPNIVGRLKWIYIEGIGLRRAEDCGGAVQGYHIDVAVSSHEEALSGNIVYCDVYYAE